MIDGQSVERYIFVNLIVGVYQVLKKYIIKSDKLRMEKNGIYTTRYLLFLIVIFFIVNTGYSQGQPADTINKNNDKIKYEMPDDYYTSFSASFGMGSLSLNGDDYFGDITHNFGGNCNFSLRFISSHLFLNIGFQYSYWEKKYSDVPNYIENCNSITFYLMPSGGINILKAKITLFIGLGVQGSIGDYLGVAGYIASLKGQYNFNKRISVGLQLYNLRCNQNSTTEINRYAGNWLNTNLYLSINLNH